MESGASDRNTALFRAWGQDGHCELEDLIPVVQGKPQRIPKTFTEPEYRDAVLDPSVLTKQACLPATDGEQAIWIGRVQSLSACAKNMRRVLADHFPKPSPAPSGGRMQPTSPGETSAISEERSRAAIAPDVALEALSALRDRKARVMRVLAARLEPAVIAGIRKLSAESHRNVCCTARLVLTRSLTRSACNGS